MSGLATMPGLVREALRTRLWSVDEIPGVGARKMEGVAFDLRAMTGQEWVRESLVFNENDASLIGGGAGIPQRHTQKGAYMIDMFFPLGKSTTRADLMVGRVLTAFKNATTLTAGDISVLITSSSSSRGQDDKDGWYFRPLMVAWECSVIE